MNAQCAYKLFSLIYPEKGIQLGNISIVFDEN